MVIIVMLKFGFIKDKDLIKFLADSSHTPVIVGVVKHFTIIIKNNINELGRLDLLTIVGIIDIESWLLVIVIDYVTHKQECKVFLFLQLTTKINK
jgi:hypothetical protein